MATAVEIVKSDLVTHIEREKGASDSHIYFFYDCEGSGGSAIKDHMIEVGVVIMTENLDLKREDKERLDREYYSSLCQCTSEIEEGAWLKHGINKETLVDQKSVRDVLKELFSWMTDRLKEVQILKQRCYSGVLVSHGGTAFDFPILVTEVKRNNCDAIFRDLELYFTDTHILCQQLRSNDDPVLRGSTRLSVSHLTSLYFPTATSLHTPHRAYNDALALKRLFSDTPLSKHMHKLELLTTDTVVQRWHEIIDCQQLTVMLGLHKQKAKRLIQKGINLKQLEDDYRKSGCNEQWLQDHLRSLGVGKPGNTCLMHFRQIL